MDADSAKRYVSQGRRELGMDTRMNITNLKRTVKGQSNTLAALEAERQLDEKAARMLDIYANQRFRSLQSSQRMRMTLLVWVIRNKLAQNMKRVLDFTVALVTVV